MTVREHLRAIYDGTEHESRVEAIHDDLVALLDDRSSGGQVAGGPGPDHEQWDERDIWVIAYPDHFQSRRRVPLATLSWALDALAPEANGVHVLPCYPWSSDDGYAVIDPTRIDPCLGTWDDVTSLASHRRVMLDAVVNHVSADSPWFEAFRRGDPEFVDGFVTADRSDDLSSVVRPRTSSLLTPFATSRGVEHVWTTFSPDQVDVDIGDPAMLLRIVDVLVGYAEAGAGAIRLDAIGYLSKQVGTSCIHLPRTHAVVRLFRAALDRHHRGVLLITETNVPHDENVAYLGGRDRREAQGVYQFSLPPLVLHSFHTGDPTALSRWADGLVDGQRPDTTALNFLASHDGIGLRPVEGLLDPADVAAMADRVVASGGVVNTRSTPGGDRPYELCTTWFDAIACGDELRGRAHHVASHAIMLLLPGIAGVYAGSLLGLSNDVGAHRATGQGRTLNRRRRIDVERLVPLASDSRAGVVNAGLRAIMSARRSSAAFHPNAPFEVAPGRAGLFRFWRGWPDDRRLAEVNVSLEEVDDLPVGGWRVTRDPRGA